MNVRVVFIRTSTKLQYMLGENAVIAWKLNYLLRLGHCFVFLKLTSTSQV